MQAQSNLGPSGELGLTVIRGGKSYPVGQQGAKVTKAPLTWKLRNIFRVGWRKHTLFGVDFQTPTPPFIKGWFAVHCVRPVANFFGLATLHSTLELKLFKADGSVIDYGIVGYRVITDTGVAFFVDDWDNDATDITTLHFHGIGTGSTAEAAGDTALVTESTTALNPDSTRATGVESQPAANQLRTVGTLTADAQIVAREHGIFSQSATGGGTLFDRTVFATVTLESADSLQSTYTCTLSSGG